MRVNGYYLVVIFQLGHILLISLLWVRMHFIFVSIMLDADFHELFDKQSYSKLVSCYELGSFSPASDPIISMYYAAAQFQLGKFLLANDILKYLESSLSNSVEYLSLYGANCRRLGLYDKAEGLLKKAVDADPNNPAYLNNYANLLIDIDKFDTAESILTKLVSDNSQYSDAVANLNRLSFKRDTSQVQHQTKVVTPSRDNKKINAEFDPLLLSFESNEVYKFGKLKRKTIENKSANKLLSDFPLNDQQELNAENIRLARQAVADKNYEFCLTLCSKILSCSGPNELIYDCAADAYIGLSRFFQAEICLYQAIALSENPSVKYYINLVSLACVRKDFQIASSLLAKASSIDPIHPNIVQLHTTILKQQSQNSSYTFEVLWPDKVLKRVQ